MAIEAELYKKLANTAGVSALVSTRIYPQFIPAGESLPAVVYQRIDGPQVQSHDGPSGLAYPRFQLTCWAETYSGAIALADAVKAAINGAKGTWTSTDVQAVLLVDEGDMYEPADGAEQQDRHGRRLDFIIWYGDGS